jgi:PKD repeat protein
MSRAFHVRRPAVVAAVALAFSGAVVAPATADTAPAQPWPVTVTSDPLPTVQINGVVWNQQIVGNTVYVGGNFTSARPAGAALGTNEVPRANMLAYNLTTGELVTSFAPTFNGQVRDLSLSPDGSTLYVAGQFTQVNGQNRYRIAAFDTATGALTPFRPSVNSTVSAVVAGTSAVYFSGLFSTVNGQARGGIAAVATGGTGTTALPFSASLDGGNAQALTLAPDEQSVVAGGSFTGVNGRTDVGFGLARLDATTGEPMALPVNSTIRNAGENAAVLSLETDGVNFYGAGFHYGGAGTMEGSFAADWATGSLVWVEDCHGDTYGVYPTGDAVYSASHKHYCGNSGGFPQTDPWSYHRATATTKTPERVNTPDPYGYPDHDGEPSPEMLYWYPDINTGTFTGKSQGPWTVTGNDSYVLYGGEFTRVNNTGQQGLVRFAKPNLAPNTDGPRLSGSQITPTAISFKSGEVRVSWPSNWDRDNETLTYTLYRGATSTPPIYTTTVTRPFWDMPRMGFVDTGLTPGASVRYRLQVSDAWGNTATSNFVSTTVSDGQVGPYAQEVLGDGASTYWRLGEASGSTAYDWAGQDDGTVGTGVTRGATGAAGDGDGASTFNGTTDGLVASQSLIDGPNTFSVEAWFRTTSTAGGKILGFGSANTGNSGSYDRHVYMGTNGKLSFGVWTGSSVTVSSSASYNDGQWHHVVASLGSNGERLYVDGVLVGQRSDVSAGQAYQGYWRVGGDNSWSGAPYFTGDIDEVAIYPTVLSYRQVVDHWTASGRVSTLPAAPADAYGAAVHALTPDLYWRLGDTAGTTATDTSWSASPGTYRVGYTLGQPGALATVPDTAVQFNGVNGLVSSNRSYANPTTYSEELWFSTTTTVGGKLIGFGNRQTGTSNNYDRHVYMLANGRLAFGVYTGTQNVITSTDAYNDGRWHHMVATQSSAGMRLYVDGDLVATGTQAGTQSYTGYWRVGGDTSWSGNAYFNGSIDEVAVYPQALTPETVLQHFQLGIVGTNQPPKPLLTASTQHLVATLDATASTDVDGTIASYAWTFGDGESGTGANVTHTYTAAGTYPVTLTVTDDGGLSRSATANVTVTAPPPNVPPTAVVGSSVTDLDVAFTGSGSSDSDGSVVSYEWAFGDGATATTADPSHHYAAAGTYTATLTVTDDRGATSVATAEVTVTEPVIPNVAPTAAIGASVTDLDVAFTGSGSSDSDGSVVSYEWAFGDGATSTTSNPSHHYATPGTYQVTLTVTDDDGATGVASQDVTVTPPNQAPTATFGHTATFLSVAFDGSGSADADGTIASYAWTFGDGETATGATAAHVYAAAGSYSVTLTVTDDDGAATVATQTVTVTAPPPNVSPVASFTATPTNLAVALDASASSDPDGSVVGYAWSFGDSSTGTGATPTHTYAAPGTYTVSLTVTDDDGASATVTQDVTVTLPPNVAPVAAFTTSAAGLTVAVNGAGSSDPDGSVVSFAWSFGDGGSGSGATVSHAYAAAGTYTVSLTVTDDRGATASVSHDVTVTEPPVQAALAVDSFGRSVSAGWGGAEVGGSWVSTGVVSGFSVAGGRGVHTAPVGTQMRSLLGGVSADSAEVQVSVSLDALPTGSGAYVFVQPRVVSSSSYAARVQVRADGTVQLHMTRNGSPFSGGVVSGLTVAAGDQLRVRVQAAGVSPTVLKAKVWKVGAAEPAAWRVETTDSTAGLQTPGSIGLISYLLASTGSTPIPFRYDDLWAGPVG